jgi:RHS repeat-associated protein
MVQDKSTLEGFLSRYRSLGMTLTYLYGVGRIAEYTGTEWAYHLGDALGSVRQISNSTAGVTMTQTYEPYGSLSSSIGTAVSNYGFANEWTDGTGLQHLRARYLDTGIGRFISRDVWGGDYNRPLSLNRWMYVEGNPVNYSDPSGLFSIGGNNITPPINPLTSLMYTLSQTGLDLDCLELYLSGGMYSAGMYDATNSRFVYIAFYRNQSELEKQMIRDAMVNIILNSSGNFYEKYIKGNRLHVLPSFWSFKSCGRWVFGAISVNVMPSCGLPTATHEIFHWIDENSGWKLSKAFMVYVGAKEVPYPMPHYDVGPELPPSYGADHPRNPPDRKEDFAESAEEYFFPHHDARIVRHERRWKFIDYLLKTGEVPQTFH